MANNEQAERAKQNRPPPGTRKKCPTCKKGTPLWFISWADMVTLLLCLFVIIVAYSSQDKGKFQSVAGSMKDAFGGNSQEKSAYPTPMGYHFVGMQFQRNIQLGQLTERVQVVLTPLINEGMANAFQDPTGMVVQMDRDVILQTGTNTMNGTSQFALADMIALIKDLPYTLEIRSAPLHVLGKPFDWHVGEAETTAIAALFEEQGKIASDRIRITTLAAAAKEGHDDAGKKQTKDKIEIRVVSEEKTTQ